MVVLKQKENMALRKESFCPTDPHTFENTSNIENTNPFDVFKDSDVNNSPYALARQKIQYENQKEMVSLSIQTKFLIIKLEFWSEKVGKRLKVLDFRKVKKKNLLLFNQKLLILSLKLMMEFETIRFTMMLKT
jgi:hypothetical protein